MKKELISLALAFSFLFPSGAALLVTQILSAPLYSQEQDEDDFADEFEDEFEDEEDEEAKKAREEAERKRLAEEARKKAEAEERKKRAAIRRKIQREETKLKEYEAQIESGSDGMHYTLPADSVEAVVELNPQGYGFRQRNHRLMFGLRGDFILKGRSDLSFDYRFFDYFSAGILVGMDWTEMSLYGRFRQQLAKPAPKQLNLFGGLYGKLRLTEWYMRTAIFLEPSLIVGHLWQTLAAQDTTHWRLAPGIFAGFETVFNSGLVFSTRLGVEFPFDFGTLNPWKEVVQPLLAIGFGFAI